MEVIADVQPLSHACQFFIISNMCTVDPSAADHDIEIEASADLSTADLFVTAVTCDWKSLATSHLPLLHRFKYVYCQPVYRRPIIILGSKSLPNYRYCFPSTFGSKFTADLTTADLFISIIIKSLGNAVPTCLLPTSMILGPLETPGMMKGEHTRYEMTKLLLCIR